MLGVVRRFLAAFSNAADDIKGLPETSVVPAAVESPQGTLKLKLFGHFLTEAVQDAALLAAPADGFMPIEDAVQAVTDSVTDALGASPSLFAARLRCVAKLNRNSSRLRAARRTVTKRPTAKRAPALYPVKRRKPVAKRAQTKIITRRPKLKSAIILRFPQRITKAQPQRHKPAA